MQGMIQEKLGKANPAVFGPPRRQVDERLVIGRLVVLEILKLIKALLGGRAAGDVRDTR
jgi:hypothetical protein